MNAPFVQPHRKNDSPEFRLSLAVADFLRLTVPAEIPWTHIGHGEIRDKRTAAKLKAMGLKPGWADYVFILPGGRAAFVELKAPGNYQTPDQRAFEQSVVAAGALYLVCRSVPEVEGALRAWGCVLKGSLS
jgi:hypothetical protein